MKNSEIAHYVAFKVHNFFEGNEPDYDSPDQTIYMNRGMLGNSFKMYDIESILEDGELTEHEREVFIQGTVRKAMVTTRLCALFLREFRDECVKKNYNSYETGRYLFNLIQTKRYVGANAPEKVSLLIYLLLSSAEYAQDSVPLSSSSFFDRFLPERNKNVNIKLPPTVYRCFCREARENGSEVVLHEFCIVGDLLGIKGSANSLFHDFGYFIMNSVHEKEWNNNPPYVVDPMFGIVCPLDEYEMVLANTLTTMLITDKHIAFTKILPLPERLQSFYNEQQILRGKPPENKFQYSDLTRPTTFLNKISSSKLSYYKVGKESKENLSHLHEISVEGRKNFI